MYLHGPFEYFKTQVMFKIKIENQIVNLIPDHKKSRIALIYLFSSDMPCIVEIFYIRFITWLQISLQSNVCTINFGLSKC